MNQELYDQMLNGGLVLLYREKRKKEILDINAAVKRKEMLLEEKKNSIKINPYSERKGFGIFLSIVGGLFFFAFLISYSIQFIENTLFLRIMEEAPSRLITDLIIGISSGAVFALGLFLAISAGKLRKKYVKQSTEEYKLEAENHIKVTEKAMVELKKISTETEEFNAKHGHFLDFLPAKYHNIEAISFMLEAVSNLRADTLKEVINLYEEELHHRNLERIAENNMRMQQLQNERMIYAMNQINENQERINSNLRDIKTMQIFDIVNNA